MPVRLPSTAAALQPIRNVVSAAGLYPLKGIWYFCAHREFWPLFGYRLIPLTVISVVVLGLLFAFTYVPQALFLLIFHGPTAWFNGVFLVLGEGQLIIALLFEAFIVDETQVDVFDVTPLQCIPLADSKLLRQLSSVKARSTSSLPPEYSFTTPRTP